MIVFMKALLSLYNIDPSIIHEAQNAKELCLFGNAASSGPFFSAQYCTVCLFFDHSTLTMAAAGPAPVSSRPIGSSDGFLESL